MTRVLILIDRLWGWGCTEAEGMAFLRLRLGCRPRTNGVREGGRRVWRGLLGSLEGGLVLGERHGADERAEVGEEDMLRYGNGIVGFVWFVV